MILCQNCGYEGDEKFCSRCGQVLEAKRINLPQILNEGIKTFTHLEKGYLYTLKELLFHPGTMQKKYLSGLRLHHQKPIAFFAISGTICALALYLIYQNAPNKTDQFFYKNYYFLVQACMLPFYALITWILYKSPKLNYAEALVMNVYMLGFMSVMIIPINSLNFIFSNGVISLLEVIFLIVYNVCTFLNFFDNKPAWLIVVKSIVSIVVCYLLFQGASELVMRLLM